MSDPTNPALEQLRPIAQAVATALDDAESVEKYLVCFQKYPEPVIQRALRAAKSIPEAKIKKSRAALFFYFVKKYAHRTN
jgi:hypothetical protein